MSRQGSTALNPGTRAGPASAPFLLPQSELQIRAKRRWRSWMPSKSINPCALGLHIAYRFTRCCEARPVHIIGRHAPSPPPSLTQRPAAMMAIISVRGASHPRRSLRSLGEAGLLVWPSGYWDYAQWRRMRVMLAARSLAFPTAVHQLSIVSRQSQGPAVHSSLSRHTGAP